MEQISTAAYSRDDAPRRMRDLARWLDNKIVLPGGIRIGFDGLIGLIPGIGDTIGTMLSFYIVTQAARMGASVTTLIRMIGNILLELFVGSIPVLGDLFDFVWKANVRNLELLDRQLNIESTARSTPERRIATSAGIVVGIGVGLAIIFIGVAIQLGLTILKIIFN